MQNLIDDMQALVDRFRASGDPAGYFAAMYVGVTHEVTRGLAAGRFSNPATLEQLTVAFADRYLAAANSDAPSRSWAVAFDAATEDSVTVVQHLLLGMNAHINLDLGIACATVAPGDAIGSIRQDFDEINTVLAQLVGRVQASMSEISWLYRFVDDVATSEEDAVINFSIGRARAEAWKFAVELAALDADDLAAEVERRDVAVARIGGDVARPPWWSRTGLAVLRFSEHKDVREVIDMFRGVSLPAT